MCLGQAIKEGMNQEVWKGAECLMGPSQDARALKGFWGVTTCRLSPAGEIDAARPRLTNLAIRVGFAGPDRSSNAGDVRRHVEKCMQ